jgi:hypothetical protein
MTPQDAIAIRKSLDISQAGFSRLLGTSIATVTRWEAFSKGKTPKNQGTGVSIESSPEAILVAIRRALDAGGESEAKVRAWAKDAVDGVGGLTAFVEKALKGGGE